MKKKQQIKIGNRSIGGDHAAFIVAEISSNHQQNYAQAEAIVRAAKKAGADAVKMQTFTPDTMTLDSQKKWFWVDGANNPDTWKGQTFYDLYMKACSPWEWHAPLQKLAHGIGLEFFSSPFDPSAVEFLETLGVPCFKIAAYESTDVTLLRAVARTGKPIFLSVGFATRDEVEFSINTLRDAGAKDLVVMHCTTSYHGEALRASTNLRTMEDIAERFDVLPGFSDNMGGVEIPALAAAMGAVVIEKHLVLNHDPAIFDDRFSLDLEEFTEMVGIIRRQEEAMGTVNYGPRTEEEEHNKRFRRSLFASKDIKKGEKFTMENVRSIRPADGLETKYIDRVLESSATCDIEFATPLSLEHLGAVNDCSK